MGRLWVEQAIFIKCPCIASTTRAVSSSANTNVNFSITHTTYSKTFNLYLHSEINYPLLTANVVFQTAYICFRSRNAKKVCAFTCFASWFTSFSRVLLTSSVGYYDGKLIASASKWLSYWFRLLNLDYSYLFSVIVIGFTKHGSAPTMYGK